MSGKLIKHTKQIEHYCRPGCVLQSVVGTELEHLGSDAMLIHDESNKYRDGDVWECDKCHKRWTFHWNGSMGYTHHIRIMASSSDWVPESQRQFKRRMKKIEE